MAWRAGLTSGTINLEWHQFARLGDFPMPSCSLGIMMGKADDWNPAGLGKAGRGGVGIEGARESERCGQSQAGRSRRKWSQDGADSLAEGLIQSQPSGTVVE